MFFIFFLLLLLFFVCFVLSLLFNLFCIQVHKVYFWLWLGRLCVLCVVWMWMYDDSNVCFMHACLLGGRCLGRRCKVLLKHPGYTLRRLCLPESGKKNYISVMYCALFPIFQLSFCLAHLHNFIYLLMWHFCYTEHVSFIYIYISTMFFFFF